MSEAMGQAVVIESRAGASGAIAALAVARAQPDGYTILFGTSGLVSSRFLLKNPPYDALKDFTPISFVVSSPSFLAVHESVPANSVAEFVEYARRNPGKLAYIHTGLGAALHLIGESINLRAGIDMLPVAYKGTGSTLVNDFISGRVQVYFPSYGTIRPFLSGGKVRLLAIIDSARLRQMPEVPTLEETFPGFYNLYGWFGFLGPAGMPRTIVDRIYTETRKGLADPKVVSQLDAYGVVIAASTPDEFALKMRSEIEVIGALSKKLRIVPE